MTVLALCLACGIGCLIGGATVIVVSATMRSAQISRAEEQSVGSGQGGDEGLR